MDPQRAEDLPKACRSRLSGSPAGSGLEAAALAELTGRLPVHVESLGDELSAVARGLATELAAETALVVVWDPEAQMARPRAAWGLRQTAEELAFRRGEGFVGRLLGAALPLAEPLGSPGEPGIGDPAAAQPITHAAGARFRSPAELSGAVCAGFAGPPVAGLGAVRRTAAAYASVAGLLLEGSPLFSDLLAPATMDLLTGCLNYAGLRDGLEREMQRSERHGHRLTCCFVDLDGFKGVNDDKGHVEANRVLAAAAGALREGLRGSDSIGRYGGDEFVILFPETQPALVFPVAVRLREGIRATSAAMGSPIDASFGVAEWRAEDSVDDLLNRADEVMRAGKQIGPGSLAADRGVARRHRAISHTAGARQRPRKKNGQDDSKLWDLLVDPAEHQNGQR